MKRTEERTEKGPFFQVHPNPPPVKPNSGAKGIKVLTQTCSQGQLKALRHTVQRGLGVKRNIIMGKRDRKAVLATKRLGIRQRVTKAARRTPGLQTLSSCPSLR